MRRPSRSAVAIERALAIAADAMSDTIAKRRKTWRADLDALRRAVQTLAATGRAKGETEAIGFMVESDPNYFDDNEENVEHGMSVDYEHEHDAPHGRGRESG